MKREDAGDLLAFLAVARERSFTRAAAKLGMTQSALSQIIRNLEERLGVRQADNLRARADQVLASLLDRAEQVAVADRPRE